MSQTPPATGYVACTGLDHDPTETRVEADEPVPAGVFSAPVLKAWLEQGVIRKAGE